LDSHSQTGDKFAKVNRRHAAITDRDVITSAIIRQFVENVILLGFAVGIVEGTVKLVRIVNIRRIDGSRKRSRFNPI
jgi:hypothetical protein